MRGKVSGEGRRPGRKAPFRACDALGHGVGFPGLALSQPGLSKAWPWAHVSHLIILAMTSQKPGHSQLSKSKETERGRVQGGFPQTWEAASCPFVIRPGQRKATSSQLHFHWPWRRCCDSACGCWKRLSVIARHCADRALRRKASPLTVQMSLKGPALRTAAREAGQTLIWPCLGSNKPRLRPPSLT